jgi:uncharacterized protein YprB with RNaseH-like and TPR domain
MFEAKGDKLKKLLSSTYRDILGREEGDITLRRRLELILRREERRKGAEAGGEVTALPGVMVTTNKGNARIREKVYPLSHRHGDFALNRAFELEKEALHLLYPGLPLDELDFSRVLFIDTETSGIAMGTGTYVFLFGAGFLTGEGFKIIQYFINDYSEEQAMLSLIEELLSQASLLISFNGKRFDIPLLDTRFIINRMGMNLNELPHLDLLYPARRLWRRTLPDCRLITLEREVFSFFRLNDIPGEEIPWHYFDYLRSGNPGLVFPIFEHNILDILSLFALFFFVLSAMNSPTELAPLLSADLSSLGRFFEGEKRIEASIACYQEEIAQGGKRAYEAARRLSLIHKRRNDFPSALSLWRWMKTKAEIFDPFPYEEEAKYYEHKLNDYHRAKETVEKAMRRLSEEDLALPRNKCQGISSALEHRLTRLMRKLGKENQQ